MRTNILTHSTDKCATVVAGVTITPARRMDGTPTIELDFGFDQVHVLDRTTAIELAAAMHATAHHQSGDA